MSAKYIPLKQVVSYFLDENDMSSGSFDKAWIIAYRALMELGFNISFEPKSVRLPVNGNQTVTLPSDYIQWSKIGVINASGEVSTLKVNTALTAFRDNNPNRLSDISPDIPDKSFAGLILSPYFLNYYFGNYYSPLFGLGGGLVQYGECKVDEANGVIILSPTYGFPDLLLEYISNPQMDGDYQIEVVAQEAIIAFLNWKFKVGSEADWYARLIEARRRLKPITLQELQQGIRENQKYCLKA
jgi:hypothetical protein